MAVNLLFPIIYYQATHPFTTTVFTLECLLTLCFSHCRLPGRSTLIRSLREQFDCGRHPRFSLPQTDIHSVASLLKQFLRELPEPIVPFQLYERVIQICTRDMHTDPDAALRCLSDVLRAMPWPHCNLLRYVCAFLHTISEDAGVNKMTAMNLATIFMHCFIRPEEDDPVLLMGTSSGRTQAVFILISKCGEIFGEGELDEAVPVVDDLLGMSGATSESELRTVGVTGNADIFGTDVSASLPEPLFPTMRENGGDDNTNVTPVVRPRSIFPKRDSSFFEPSMSIRRFSLTNSESAYQANSPEFHRSQSHSTIGRSSPSSPRPRPQGFRLSESYNGRNADTISPASSPLSTTSIDTSNDDSPKTDFDHNEEDEALDALINVDLSRFSLDEVYSHVDTLCSELRELRNMVKELNAKVLRLDERHCRQQEKMAEKVYSEKMATSTAVQRIVDLQAQIQAYQMKYGPLD